MNPRGKAHGKCCIKGEYIEKYGYPYLWHHSYFILV